MEENKIVATVTPKDATLEEALAYFEGSDVYVMSVVPEGDGSRIQYLNDGLRSVLVPSETMQSNPKLKSMMEFAVKG